VRFDDVHGVHVEQHGKHPDAFSELVDPRFDHVLGGSDESSFRIPGRIYQHEVGDGRESVDQVLSDHSGRRLHLIIHHLGMDRKDGKRGTFELE